MRYQSNGTCSYLPSHVSYLYEQKRNVMRQNAFARARAAPKRKLRSDDSDEECQQPSPVAATNSRVVIDEFGNHVVADRLKRMRVSSPPFSSPASPPQTSDDEDVAMEEDGELSTAIVRTARSPLSPTVSPAAKKFVSASVASALTTEAACRAIVLFDPLPRIEKMPRIEFPCDDDESDSDSSSEEPFVRFEELPDDYEEEPEAMEVD